MRAMSIFAGAFVLAAAMFWATMLTDPPATEAAPHGKLDIREMTIKANPSTGEPYDGF